MATEHWLPNTTDNSSTFNNKCVCEASFRTLSWFCLLSTIFIFFSHFIFFLCYFFWGRKEKQSHFLFECATVSKVCASASSRIHWNNNIFLKETMEWSMRVCVWAREEKLFSQSHLLPQLGNYMVVADFKWRETAAKSKQTENRWVLMVKLQNGKPAANPFFWSTKCNKIINIAEKNNIKIDLEGTKKARSECERKWWQSDGRMNGT